MKWSTAKLGAVTKIVSGSTPKSGNPAFWGGDIPWATPTDLSGLATKELATTGRMITKAGLASCSAAMLPARSVLFSSRAPIGLVAINKDPLCTNQGFKSLVPDKARLSPDFLYWWLKCHRAALEHLGRGATFKEVSKSIIEAVEIPLPPLAEQKRIAAILDAADALRAKRREALAQLDALLQSTFLTLFGDPVSNPMGWEKPALLELCSARQWPTISGSQLEPCGYPVYGANGQIGYYPKYNHEHPTVLVTCRGATCGTINICPPKCYVTGNAMALDDPDPKRITLSYLEWVLRIRGMNDVICGAAQPQITRTGMAPITIPLPPLALQQKFAAIVESIERQKTAQRAHLAELDALFAALQHRAFRGEL